MDDTKKTKQTSETEEITPSEEMKVDENTTIEAVTPADEIEGEIEGETPEYATPNAIEVAAEVEEEEGTVEEVRHATPNATSSLLNLESLINGFIVDMEKLQEKMKTQREMFNDAFNNDAEYSQIMQKVKEVNRVKSAAKQRIMKLPNVVEMANKIREYRDELKDIQEGLSSYLQQYKELSGSNQITRDNGEVAEIVSITKLVKRRG